MFGLEFQSQRGSNRCTFCLEFDPDSGCLHIQFFQGIETVLQENMNELK